MGGALLAYWGLPKILCDTVAYWHRWDHLAVAAGDELRSLCHVLEASDAIADLVCEAEGGSSLCRVYECVARHFGISEGEIDDFIVRLQERVRMMASALDIDVSDIYDYVSILDEAHQQMLRLSLDTVVDLDRLTGIASRTYFDLRLKEVIAARQKEHRLDALGILMLDIDRFKTVNDMYGHVVGDRVLRNVASWLATAIRKTDLVARYGGEEFVVIVPSTDLADLENLAERLRRDVELGVVMHDREPLSVTISVGGCVAEVDCKNGGEALLMSADQCLYEAKEAGRNRCVCRECWQARA